MSRTKWVIGCCVLAMLGLVGCSSDDVEEILGIDPEGEAAEAAVEAALNDVVDPLLLALDLISAQILAPPPPAPAFSALGGGVTCPDTGDWCDSGSASCTVGASGPEFTFSSCAMSDGLGTVTVSGDLDVTLPSSFTLVNLVVNGGLGLSGTVVYSGDCDMNWNVTATDGTVVFGTIVQCALDTNPQSQSSLVITAQVSGVGTVQMTFTFDGTSTAGVSVTVDGSPYATCSVNIDTHDANCEGV